MGESDLFGGFGFRIINRLHKMENLEKNTSLEMGGKIVEVHMVLVLFKFKYKCMQYAVHQYVS